jgi:hypothetical protein
MFSRIFPKVIDNSYRGHWLGLVLFVLVIVLRTTQGINSMVITRTVITGADAIPLDTFSQPAANTLISVFALLGVSSLIVSLIGLIALVRYRAMIPLLFLVIFVSQIGARLILFIYPIARSADLSMNYAGQPIGFWFNLGVMAMTLIGFILSLQNRREAAR